MTLTPVQQAMCAVIREGGFQSLFNVAKSAGSKRMEISREEVPQPYSGDGYVRCEPGEWTVTIDNHTLTEQEYNQWAERNASKNCAD